MQPSHNNSIFWVEVDKIKPNPQQPRKEFDDVKLRDLSDSIRQYGVLQPLVVTRVEIEKPDGGIAVEYELIAGERRLRASKLARIFQVPVIIRANVEDDRTKLELAIIENLQREDLSAVDRATAFKRLSHDFGFTHAEIAKKIGKSREFVSNSMRLLLLPQEIIDALLRGDISEGHARPILMLIERPEEQTTLFKEIILKKLNVREAEGIARRIAYDKVRKKDRAIAPEIVEIEEDLTEKLGTRVHIERKLIGGKITIDYFTSDDLDNLINLLTEGAQSSSQKTKTEAENSHVSNNIDIKELEENVSQPNNNIVDDRIPNSNIEDENDDLYNIKKFTI